MSVFNKSYVKSKYGFSIGDVVTLVTKDPNNAVSVGTIGIVCDLDHNFVGSDVGIELDYEHPNNHNCCGCCKNRYGRYVPHECLKLVVIDFGEIDTSVNSVDELFNSIL